MRDIDTRPKIFYFVENIVVHSRDVTKHRSQHVTHMVSLFPY